MAPYRLTALLTLVVLFGASAAVAGPLSVKVNSAITADASQTPLSPPPGIFAAEANFDMTPGTSTTIASFGGSSSWITPSGVTPTNATLVNREFFFKYHATVTDTTSGQSAKFGFDGRAFANWVEGVDGGVYAPQRGAMLSPGMASDGGGGSPTAFTLGANRYSLMLNPYQSSPIETTMKGQSVVIATPENIGVDVVLTVMAVPEPGTLTLGLFGLTAFGTMLRRRLAR